MKNSTNFKKLLRKSRFFAIAVFGGGEKANFGANGISILRTGRCILLNGYRRFQSYVTDKLPLLVLLFCAAQPVLDVLGYWQNE